MKLKVWVIAAALATGNGNVNPSPARAGNAVDRATENCWRSASSDCVLRLTIQAAKAFVARSDWELEIRAGAFAAGAAARAMMGDAEDASVNFDRAVAAARTIQSEYVRAGALRNVASVQAGAGAVDPARATALSIRDAQGRIDALVDVASASARKGDLRAALESFRIAIAAVGSSGESSLRKRDLSKVAVAQAEVGYTASARRTVRSIDDAEGRIAAFSVVASTLAKEGRDEDARAFFDLAVEDAGAVIDGYRRAIALGKVAWAQAEAGDETGARTTLDRALQAGGRGMDIYSAGVTIASLADVDPYVFIQIAGAQRKVEDLNGARRTLRRALQLVSENSSPSQVKWLFNIASAQSAAGDAAGARQTIEAAARRLRAGSDGDFAQNLVYHIASDQLETLLEIVVSINTEDVETKRNLVYHVAMRQAQTGEIARSLQNARKIDRVSRRDAVFKEIVSAQARARRFTAATSTAGSIRDSNKRVRALSEIAQGQAKSGDAVGAGKTLRQATAELSGSDGAGITTWTYTELARAQVEAGRTGEAKQTLRAALRELKSASPLARATWLPEVLDVIRKTE